MDKKDLQEIENIIDKKLDARFSKFTLELSEVLKDFTYTIDKRFSTMEAKFDKKFADMEAKFDKKFADMEVKFDKKFADMNVKFDKKIEEQNKKIDTQNKKLDMQGKKLDFVVNCYKENLDKHSEYDNNLSKINSRLFDHNLRLDSLEGATVNNAI